MKKNLARIICYYLLICVPLEAVLGSLINKYFGSGFVVQFFLIFKYLLICLFGVTIGLVSFEGIKNKVDIYFLSYLFLVTLYVLGGYVSGFNLDSYLYLYVFPVAIYYVGRNAVKVSEASLIRILVLMATISSLFGLIDYFFLDEFFWLDLVRYGDYISDVKNMPETVLFDLPGNFYFDPFLLKIRRLVGLQGDPLAFAYHVGFVIVFLIYKKNYLNKLYMFCLGIMIFSLLLTLTRAVILMLLISLIPKINEKMLKYTVASMLIVSLLIVFYSTLGVDIELSDVDSSTSGHANSIKSFGSLFAWSDLILGSLGHQNFLFYEPALLNILQNFGLIGFSLFISAIVSLLTQLMKNGHIGVAIYFSCGLFSMAIFSQSFLSISASAISWLFAGFYTRYTK